MKFADVLAVPPDLNKDNSDAQFTFSFSCHLEAYVHNNTHTNGNVFRRVVLFAVAGLGDNSYVVHLVCILAAWADGVRENNYVQDTVSLFDFVSCTLLNLSMIFICHVLEFRDPHSSDILRRRRVKYLRDVRNRKQKYNLDAVRPREDHENAVPIIRAFDRPHQRSQSIAFKLGLLAHDGRIATKVYELWRKTFLFATLRYAYSYVGLVFWECLALDLALPPDIISYILGCG